MVVFAGRRLEDARTLGELGIERETGAGARTRRRVARCSLTRCGAPTMRALAAIMVGRAAGVAAAPAPVRTMVPVAEDAGDLIPLSFKRLTGEMTVVNFPRNRPLGEVKALLEVCVRGCLCTGAYCGASFAHARAGGGGRLSRSCTSPARVSGSCSAASACRRTARPRGTDATTRP